MKVTYQLSRQVLKEGAKAFYRHRHQSRLNIVVVSLATALFILFYLVLDADLGMRIPIAILFGAAIWMVWQSHRSIAETVENAFTGNPNDRMITLTAADGVLTITDGESTGTSPFSSFVDSKICKKGLLLYPQKNIFYWIPDTAEIEDGTWREFTEIISSQITRKI